VRAPSLALILLLALGGAARAEASDSDAARAQLDASEARAAEAQAELARLNRETEALAAELAELRQTLVRRAAALRDQEDAIETATVQLAGLRAQAAQRSARLLDRREDIAAVLVRLTRLSRRPPLTTLAAPAPLLNSLRGAGAMRAMVDPLQTEADALSTELRELAALTNEVEARRQTLETQRNELLQSRREMLALVDKRKVAHLALSRNRAATDRELQKSLAEARSLRALLDRLLAEEARKREAARLATETARLAEQGRQAAVAARRTAAVTAALREVEADRAAAEAERARVAAEAATVPHPETRLAALPGVTTALPFSATQGHLRMPATGRVVGQFGSRNRFGQHAKGIRLATAAGATVVAPHDAEVVFAGPFRGYGQLLILSQGEGYHILLAGMSRLYAVAGQPVLAGEPVGEMGPDGSDTTLYVELRRQGEPINPLSWLIADKGKVSG
jgi:septal ring factor EnvC (AmiA/AmiB activator)